MASLTQSTWIWANSKNWWWTGNPGVLPSMGSQSRQSWATELIRDNDGHDIIIKGFIWEEYITIINVCAPIIGAHHYIWWILTATKGEFDSNTILVCSVSQSLVTLCDPVDCSPLTSSVMEFSRQENWNELFVHPRVLPDSEIQSASPCIEGRFFLHWATSEARDFNIPLSLMERYSLERRSIRKDGP